MSFFKVKVFASVLRLDDSVVFGHGRLLLQLVVDRRVLRVDVLLLFKCFASSGVDLFEGRSGAIFLLSKQPVILRVIAVVRNLAADDASVKY